MNDPLAEVHVHAGVSIGVDRAGDLLLTRSGAIAHAEMIEHVCEVEGGSPYSSGSKSHGSPEQWEQP